MKKAVDKFFHHHTHHDDQHSSEVHTTSRSSIKSHATEGHTHHVDKHITKDSSGMLIHKEVATPIEETVLRPALVQETVREDVVVEVQPVIHRLIEVPEVHHIERHIYEKVLPSGPSVITKQPIVDVTIQPRIIEDVTTIVHREVPETVVVHEEQHINESIVRPTVYTKEVLNERQTRIVDVSTTSLHHTTARSEYTTDPTLRQIAEPHERSTVHPRSNIVVPTQKWVAAYPRAMVLKQAGKSEKSDVHKKSSPKDHKKSEKNVDEKADEKSVKKSDDKSEKADEKSEKKSHKESEKKISDKKSEKKSDEKSEKKSDKEHSDKKLADKKSSEKDTLKHEKSSDKDHHKSVEKVSDKDSHKSDEKGKHTKETKEVSKKEVHKDDKKHKSEHKLKSSEKAFEKEEKKEFDKNIEVSPQLAAANDPTSAHRSGGGPSLDHPVFIERKEEHSSLDVRAMLSLERRADLLTTGSDLPGFSAQSHVLQVDRGHDDLERGSQIGLESHHNDHHKAPSSPSKKDTKDKEGKTKESKKDVKKDVKKEETKKESKKEEMKKESKKEEKESKKESSKSSSSSSSHKNKLEEELRQKNKMGDPSGRFVMASLKHNNYEQ